MLGFIGKRRGGRKERQRFFFLVAVEFENERDRKGWAFVLASFFSCRDGYGMRKEGMLGKGMEEKERTGKERERETRWEKGDKTYWE